MITFRSTSLDDSTTSTFPVLQDITHLAFVNQKFTSASVLGRFTSLQEMKFFQTPVIDDMIRQLTGCRATLESLELCDTNVTLEGLSLLRDFPKRHTVAFLRSPSTKEGICELAAIPSLRRLVVDQRVFSKKLTREVQMINPQVMLSMRESHLRGDH